MTQYASAIYEGIVQHRRSYPVMHQFRYTVFMMYLDVDELDTIFCLSPLWSRKRFCLARFKRDDFHGDPHCSLRDAINLTLEHNGVRPCNGPIRMLVNLRYFGYNMNPLSVYYCFDCKGEKLMAIVAEVHNTPWGERHAYVLPIKHDDSVSEKILHETRFSKQFHVSPFNGIDMDYIWRSSMPKDKLAINIENWEGGNKIMDASIALKRKDISRKSLNVLLIRFPFMTIKVIVAIYWQAFKLWCKKVPYVGHSGRGRL